MLWKSWLCIIAGKNTGNYYRQYNDEEPLENKAEA